MFSKLDLLWIRQLLIGFLTVIGALLVIDFLGKVFDEMGDVQDQGYTLTAMLFYCLAIVPSKIHTFFPMSFLVGALIGLGRLTQSSELTVMQVSGYSRLHIALIGCLIAIMSGVGVLTLSEFLGQPLKRYAEGYRIERQGQLAGNLSVGFWSQDQGRVLNVGGVNNEGQLVFVRQFFASKPSKGFDTRLLAQKAEFVDGGWLLHDVTTTSYTDSKVVERYQDKLFWATRLAPDIAKTLASSPEDLSLQELYRFSNYQSANGIDAQKHNMLLLSRLLLPITGAVMLVLALPFSFGHSRSRSLGVRIAIGMALGLIYFIVNGSITNIVILTGLSVVIGVLVPIVIFGLAGLVGLKFSR